MKLKQHLEYNGYEARNKKEHVLGADPSLSASDGGRTWWRSDNGQFRGWDGAAAQTLTNLVEKVTGTGALSAVLAANKEVTLSIAAATQSVPGTMSASDKLKSDSATAGNTPGTLVQRDGNGDFSAGTISAALNGLAANSTLLAGLTLTQIRDFSQTTGQRGSRSALTDIDTVIQGTRLDQLTAPTSNVSINNQRLVSVADPVNPQDAASKNYVDSVATGLDPKGSVRMATTAALPTCVYANGSAGVGATLTASANGVLGTVGGLTAAVGDRMLVKNQGTPAHHGIYRVTDIGSASTPWILTRATDADQAAEVSGGLFTFVEAGTLVATGWVLNVTGTVTIGTTALPFQQFSGAGTYLNGNGLSLTGSTFAVVGTANRITVSGSGVDIASNYVGQNTITTLGTVTTGTWQGTPVGLAYGGTGATTAVGARSSLGASSVRAVDIPAGAVFTWNHGMNTRDVIPMVVEVATGDFVQVDPNVVDANNIKVTFGDPVANGAYRLIVAFANV